MLPLCLAPCLWEADWGEWVLCSHFSRLVLLGESMSLVPTPLLLCTVEPLDVAGCCGPAPRPIFLSPKVTVLLCLSPMVVLCGLPCSPGTGLESHVLGLDCGLPDCTVRIGVIVLPALVKGRGFVSSGRAFESGN